MANPNYKLLFHGVEAAAGVRTTVGAEVKLDGATLDTLSEVVNGTAAAVGVGVAGSIVGNGVG